MKIYYDARYNATGVSFDTTRKASCIARSLGERPIEGVELTSPHPVPWSDLEVVHDPEYLAALESGTPIHLATGAGLGWDEAYSLAVRWSTGGLCEAVLEALRSGRNAGTLSSGLHHAHRSHGKGFCSLNGLALAAVLAVKDGARRVLILDLDAHCGGGTAEIITGWPQIEQVDVSVVPFDLYESTEQSRLILVTGIRSGEEYLDVVRRALDEIGDPSSIDVLVYNAGMDPHGEAGGVSVVDREILRRREDMVFDWARENGVPVAWTIAGGYTSTEFSMDDLVDLHRMTIEASAAHANSGHHISGHDISGHTVSDPAITRRAGTFVSDATTEHD